ncbi:SAC3 family protein B isoform X2 [Cucumis melo]|uniref:SAC3 family protein B isoform X2 n=1 Tax=Cucumis melo TaxID=3656 RepID=A0A1S3AX93_CUCME|nr:SAC3 family protein B isoform X2 [Cucumis melo]
MMLCFLSEEDKRSLGILAFGWNLISSQKTLYFVELNSPPCRKKFVWGLLSALMKLFYVGRTVSPSPTVEDQPKVRGILPNAQAYQVRFASKQSHDHESNILTEFGNVQAPKRTKSPERLRSAQTNLPRANAHEVMSSMRTTDAESVATGSPSVPVPKRTRSPTFPSSDQVSGPNFYPTHDDTERERLAKAKRLARFKLELDEVTHNKMGGVDVMDNTNRNECSTTERDKYMSSQSLDLSRNLAHGNAISDNDALESSSIIIGLCPDMCPESERGERERKGDLDHYERLDGDRNQTSKLLAVKKYTRTAEREAILIRPMPVLLKTIDYLLDLLSQPYDEKFLGIYNFLWDRMRAIRMDLRMQHLFNENAITMLEQMIRLHIIAMHELCEFSKGEGFAEGFDAHLNIEQMNKTSVELFQMYDDHRKRGIIVPSEKEFRGYYALLKLDKHPGYKVEPAELSLDLAKMTPEMRQTAEVKFARDVARACRTSNFIAFFRLVRKASYLQACLMHAHFAKLRTQALASLHSGVQNNQGLPIAHVRKWIGMEEEDIEGLLEYHGFSVKVFEEPYMVREGPFLNNDKDFPTKCSKLVHMKRSRMIVNDVLLKSKTECLISGATKKDLLTRKSKNEYLIPDASKQIPLTSTKKEPKTFSFEKISSPRPISTKEESAIHEIDEEMAEFDDQLIPIDHKQVQPKIETSEVRQLHEFKYNHEENGDLQSSPRSCEPLRTEVQFVGNQGYDGLFMTSPVGNNSARMSPLPLVSDAPPQKISASGYKQPLQKISASGYKQALHQKISASGYNNNTIRSVEPQSIVNNVMEDEEILNATQENGIDIITDSCPDEEIANARLKLILRLWKRRALKRKQLREQRLLAAKAAFDTLSVGPPIQLNSHKIRSNGIFDIDHIVSERWKRQKMSCSIVNVSEVVASILSRRNLDGKCICWKLVVCSQGTRDSHFAAGSWLLSKLMPSEANDLVFSSSFLSIWMSWLSGKTGLDLSCFLSIVRHANFDNLPETVHGASAILFVATESIPLHLQRVQLHELVASIPSGSCLPLLILSDFDDEISASLANRLDLYNIDKLRIHSFQIVSLLDNPHLRHLGFFSDEKLKEGLKWLANESPTQPVLHRVKALDLIIPHLDSSMKVLDSMNEKEVSPNHCISAFNLALDQSVADITAAVKANPSNWPCPEIALLESCSKPAFVTDALPPVGWSSVENVEPLKQALMDLKLPTFPDISWLTKGSNTIKEIPTVRDNLESSLRCYLTKTSEIMVQQLALEEAHIMLQKCAKLEHHNFNYSIVPRWVTIFRRIFNWRLRCFPSRSSYAHIVNCCHGASVSSSTMLESREPPSYLPNQPLLDEVIEVAFSSLSINHERDFSEAHQPPATTTSNVRPHEVVVATINFSNDNGYRTQQICFGSSKSVANSDRELNCAGKEVAVSDRGYSESERLKELLDQCNKRQNAIEKMLSVYF